MFFGEMADHVADLVNLAALHDRSLARRLPHSREQGFAAIQNIQPRNFEIHAAFLQIGQQLLDHRGVFAWPPDAALAPASARVPSRPCAVINC